MEKSKNTGNYLHHLIKSLLVSVGIGEIITAVMLSIFAFLMSKWDLPLTVLDILVWIATVSGASAAGYLSGRFLREKGLLYGGLCGVVMVLILLLCGVILSHLTSAGMLTAKLVGILAGSAIGGVLGVNKKQKRIKY